MKWLPSAHHYKAPLRQLKVGHFIHNLLLFIGILFVRTFEGHQDQLLELVQHWYWYQSILCAAHSDHLLRPFGPALVRTFALVIHWTAVVELSTRGLSCRRPAAVELWSHLLKRSFCSTRAQRAPLRLLQTGHHSRSPAGRPTKTQFC